MSAVSRSVIAFRSSSDRAARRIEFGVDARLDGQGVPDVLSRQLDPLAADLLEVAAAVYAVDRSVVRPRYAGFERGENWARQIDLTIPVRCRERWESVRTDLAELLAWLTDDEWSVSFSESDRDRLTGGQGYLVSTLPDDIEPVLFSGGLDSSAGLALRLGGPPLLPVSVRTNNDMAGVQERVLSRLRGVSREVLPAASFRVNLTQSRTRAPGAKQENSQRSRGLLFLAAGIAVAITLGKGRLWFLENGIGAINLPYLRSQVGSQATRSAHPRTVQAMARLAGTLTGQDFAVETPLLGLTKAEAVSAVPPEYEHAIACSVSCDTGFASRISGHPPCGTCTSCLLRRQAVTASRYPKLDEGKRFRRIPDRTTPELAAMLWQASRIESRLAEQDPWSGFVEEFPEIAGAAEFVPRDRLLRLFGAYVREWPKVLASMDVPVGDWFSGQELAS
ncbi:7-cyano-7-deazaguanine synthase [Amycolatopsis sp. M39]|nr:7-cyano-7-deazaguanine synthase [Amycolatopsis sp. M39]